MSDINQGKVLGVHELGAVIDGHLKQFKEDDTSSMKKVAVGAGVGIAGAGYVARQKSPLRNKILRAEVKAENAVRKGADKAGDMGKKAVKATKGKAKRVAEMVRSAVSKKRFSSAEEQDAYVSRAYDLCSKVDDMTHLG